MKIRLSCLFFILLLSTVCCSKEEPTSILVFEADTTAESIDGQGYLADGQEMVIVYTLLKGKPSGDIIIDNVDLGSVLAGRHSGILTLYYVNGEIVSRTLNEGNVLVLTAPSDKYCINVQCVTPLYGGNPSISRDIPFREGRKVIRLPSLSVE